MTIAQGNVWLISSLDAPEVVLWAQPMEGLQIGIQANKTTFAPDEPIEIAVTVKNVSNRPIQLSRRTTHSAGQIKLGSQIKIFNPYGQPLASPQEKKKKDDAVSRLATPMLSGGSVTLHIGEVIREKIIVGKNVKLSQSQTVYDPNTEPNTVILVETDVPPMPPGNYLLVTKRRAPHFDNLGVFELTSPPLPITILEPKQN